MCLNVTRILNCFFYFIPRRGCIKTVKKEEEKKFIFQFPVTGGIFFSLTERAGGFTGVCVWGRGGVW